MLHVSPACYCLVTDNHVCLSVRPSDGLSVESDSDESDLELAVNEPKNTHITPHSGK